MLSVVHEARFDDDIKRIAGSLINGDWVFKEFMGAIAESPELLGEQTDKDGVLGAVAKSENNSVSECVVYFRFDHEQVFAIAAQEAD